MPAPPYNHFVIWGGLLVGSEPEDNQIGQLIEMGIKLVAVCRPDRPAQRGIPEIWDNIPFRANNVEPDDEELETIISFARKIIPHLEQGEKVVLVEPLPYWRAQLVAAVVLHLHLGLTGQQAIGLIEAKMPTWWFHSGSKTVVRRLA